MAARRRAAVDALLHGRPPPDRARRRRPACRSPGFGSDRRCRTWRRPYNGSPTVYKRLAARRHQQPRPARCARFDARTGAKLWEFRSVPQERRRARLRHLGRTAAWKGSAGAISWAFSMTIDPAAQHALRGLRQPDARLLRRRPARRQSVRQLDRGARRRHRRIQVALPDDASRPVGLRHSAAAGAARCDRSTAATVPVLDAGAQDRLHVHPESRDGQAGVRHRGAAGAGERRARREGVADAADSGEAAGRSRASATSPTTS